MRWVVVTKIFVLCWGGSLFAQDFSSIQKILKNDQLAQRAAQKKLEDAQLKKIEEERKKSAFNIPNREDIFSWLSEYYLVKYRETLQWDHPFVDYSLVEPLQELLKKSKIKVRFKILVLKNDQFTHYALPDGKNVILLISLALLKELSFDGRDIAFLLWQDILRVQLGFFQNKFITPDIAKHLATNSYPRKMNISFLDNYLKRYHQLIWQEGFTFAEQYKLTQKVAMLLKGDDLNNYMAMLTKLSKLISISPLFKNYAKLYPSPEFQLNWIKK